MSAYFPHGTNIYDLHFFTGELKYLGSEYFDTPLEPCTWHTTSLEVPEGTNTGSIIIYLTDENHNIWGQFGFYNYDAATEETISPKGIHELSLGDSLTPVVTVRNFGSETVSFPVTYHLESFDGTVWLDDEAWVEDLPSGESTDVEFLPIPSEYFGPPEGEPFDGIIYFQTWLEGDQVPENDFMETEFEIVVLPME